MALFLKQKKSSRISIYMKLSRISIYMNEGYYLMSGEILECYFTRNQETRRKYLEDIKKGETLECYFTRNHRRYKKRKTGR